MFVTGENAKAVEKTGLFQGGNRWGVSGLAVEKPNFSTFSTGFSTSGLECEKPGSFALGLHNYFTVFRQNPYFSGTYNFVNGLFTGKKLGIDKLFCRGTARQGTKSLQK